MKNLIESLGITHRRFAEQFNIPYNTVAQWYKGKRAVPEWLKSLFNENIGLKRYGKTIPIEIPIKTFLAMYIGGDYKDECVFVPTNDHEERITIFDGTEIVTAFWLDLDGKTWKLFVELSL